MQKLLFGMAVAGALSLAAGAAHAQGRGVGGRSFENGNPPGFGVRDDRPGWNGGTQPPGWSRAQTSPGWRGGTMPPGLAKKSATTTRAARRSRR